MNKKIETVRTLASGINTQFKFTLLGGSEKVVALSKHFFDLFNITYGIQEELSINDTYYDNSKYGLKNSRVSLRLRNVSNKGIYITFKRERNIKRANSAVVRDEIEFGVDSNDVSDEISEKILNKIENTLSDGYKFKDNAKTLKPVLFVNNIRTQCPIKTKTGNYLFCFDRYYFKDKSNNYSEYYSEIEIEATGNVDQNDMDLVKYIDAICKIFDYVPDNVGKYKRGFKWLKNDGSKCNKGKGDTEQSRFSNVRHDILDYKPNKVSKYERGVEWLEKKDNDYKIIYALIIDIVDYSVRPTDVQKQIVQMMNAYAKETLKIIRPDDYDRIVTIPTGDGLLFIFEDEPDQLITLVFEMQNKVSKLYNTININNRFEFRAGLHTGPVFTFTDINENVNYAGNGINISQRAMSFGGKWHILATEEAYQSIVQKNSHLKTIFNKLPKAYMAKHDVLITLYNIYDDQGHGNKETPK